MENAMSDNSGKAWKPAERRFFIGGSDARIIIGSDEATLVRLLREKRGEAGPEGLAGRLIVQLGRGNEGTKSAYYESTTHRRERRAGGARRATPGQALSNSVDGSHP